MSTDYAFIPGYGMRYSVTRDGRVYSNVTQRWLKPIKHPLGYVCVNLTLRDGKGGKKQHLIHVLIAQAFVPNPENKPTVNHKNGVKADNRADNLEWATYSENHAHAYRELGRCVNAATLRDSSRPCALVTADGKTMRFKSARAAAEATGLRERSVARACRGERKTCGGYWWAYVD